MQTCPVSHDEPCALCRAPARRDAAAPAPDSTLEQVRAALNGDDGHLDNLQRAAKRLAMSPRTLQRRLSEAGTTFRRELALARIRRAQHLLVSSELSMSRVAFEVGFSTSQ